MVRAVFFGEESKYCCRQAGQRYTGIM
jgi:hypothetical protein